MSAIIGLVNPGWKTSLLLFGLRGDQVEKRGQSDSDANSPAVIEGQQLFTFTGGIFAFVFVSVFVSVFVFVSVYVSVFVPVFVFVSVFVFALVMKESEVSV